MKFRWIIKDLQTKTDNEILLGLVAEWHSELNPYTPLAERLDKIYDKLWGKIQAARRAA